MGKRPSRTPINVEARSVLNNVWIPYCSTSFANGQVADLSGQQFSIRRKIVPQRSSRIAKSGGSGLDGNRRMHTIQAEEEDAGKRKRTKISNRCLSGNQFQAAKPQERVILARRLPGTSRAWWEIAAPAGHLLALIRPL